MRTGCVHGATRASPSVPRRGTEGSRGVTHSPSRTSTTSRRSGSRTRPTGPGRTSCRRRSPRPPAWTRSRSGRTTPPPAPSSATSTSATRTSTASAGGTTSHSSRTLPSRPTAESSGRRTASSRQPPLARAVSIRAAPYGRTATAWCTRSSPTSRRRRTSGVRRWCDRSTADTRGRPRATW